MLQMDYGLVMLLERHQSMWDYTPDILVSCYDSSCVTTWQLSLTRVGGGGALRSENCF